MDILHLNICNANVAAAVLSIPILSAIHEKQDLTIGAITGFLENGFLKSAHRAATDISAMNQ